MKRIIVLFAVVAGVVAVWTGVWLYIAARINDEAARLAAPGPGMPAIACRDFSVAGFPFRFDVACAGLSIKDGDRTFELAGFKATALVYRPTHFIAFATAPLIISDAFYGSRRQLDWSLFEASLRLDGFRLARFSALAEDLQFTDQLFGETLLAATPHAELHLIGLPRQENAPQDEAAIGLFMRADAADIPGLAVEEANLTAEAETGSLPADIRDWQRPGLLRLWQSRGGELTLHRIEAVASDASATLTGSLALNTNGETEGSLTLQSGGLDRRLDPLLPPEMRDIVLGGAQPDGNRRQVFTIRQGAVLAGLVPVGLIPPLF